MAADIPVVQRCSSSTSAESTDAGSRVEQKEEEGSGLRLRTQAKLTNEGAPQGESVTEVGQPSTLFSSLESQKKKKNNSPFWNVTSWFPRSKEGAWLTCRVEVDVAWCVVIALGCLIRFWRIHYPPYVLFDEVHFGKFASYYLRREFFFDVHPPLGKLIFAAIGYLVGFDGSFLFDNIGNAFPSTVPYVAMRCVSALAGSLLMPCVFQIMLELGFSHRTAILATVFTLLDNSLVIQSRVIMLDSFLILFTYTSVLCYLKFYHCRYEPFSERWHKWLALTGVSLGLLLGVKYTGLLGLGCVGLLTVCDLWQLIGNPFLQLADLFLHTLLRGLYLLGIPLLVNMALFYIHFSILVYSGPGNAYVSRSFKYSLLDSDSSAARAFPTNATFLRYGSNITLSSPDYSCWLHSHAHLYPLKYSDGRGSSYQQQVTCYEFRDPNNAWTVLKYQEPSNDGQDSGTVVNSFGLVRNRDVVRLAHASSQKLLNSHDVAGPLSPIKQEVSGYINYSSEFVPYLQWRVEVLGVGGGDAILMSPGSKVELKLFHVHSTQVLTTTGKRLPEWGFQQYEVVTDRVTDGGNTRWILNLVDQPATSGNDSLLEEEEEKERERIQSEDERRKEVQDSGGGLLSFWEKYIELQHHMVTAHGNLGDHQFGAKPQSWPLMGKTLPYWLDEESNAQVTLIGNPVLWWVGTAAIFLFVGVTSFYLLRRKRGMLDIPTVEFDHWFTTGSVLLVGWLLHFAPYFFVSRVLFLHHYLPALAFKHMLLAATCDHLYERSRLLQPKAVARVLRVGYYCLVAGLLLAFTASFLAFSPFTYGHPSLTQGQIEMLKWRVSWDLLIRIRT